MLRYHVQTSYRAENIQARVMRGARKRRYRFQLQLLCQNLVLRRVFVTTSDFDEPNLILVFVQIREYLGSPCLPEEGADKSGFLAGKIAGIESVLVLEVLEFDMCELAGPV